MVMEAMAKNTMLATAIEMNISIRVNAPRGRRLVVEITLHSITRINGAHRPVPRRPVRPSESHGYHEQVVGVAGVGEGRVGRYTQCSKVSKPARIVVVGVRCRDVTS